MIQEQRAAKLLLKAGLVVAGREEWQKRAQEYTLPTYGELAELAAYAEEERVRLFDLAEKADKEKLDQSTEMMKLQDQINNADKKMRGALLEKEEVLTKVATALMAIQDFAGHLPDCEVVELASLGRVMKPTNEEETCTCGYSAKKKLAVDALRGK